MPPHRFAVITKFENPDTTTHVVYPALLDSSTTRKTGDMNRAPHHAIVCGVVDRDPVAPPGLRQNERTMGEDPLNQGTVHNVALLHQVPVARGEAELECHLGDAMAPSSPISEVAPHVLHEKESQTDNGFMNRYVSIIRYNLAQSPRHVAVGGSALQPYEDESISWAIRTRRRVVRHSPYPTRSKCSTQSSRTSPNQTSVSTTAHSEDETSLNSYGRNSTSAATASSESQTSSPSPAIDTHIVQASFLTPSGFGYTAFDYNQRKVQNKNVHTSWYTYTTSGPIDHPPELPHNAVGLQHNVIFMHINETERAKYQNGRRQLSNLLKYCIRMWIWDGVSSKWEKICVGERRVVDGYRLSLSLRYLKTIHPQWVITKSLKRLIAENS
ncbi:hypothetical protein EV361DRAFT_956673 [Lentinula raphanica]|nr:hypothetical protein EV361DRAFT_956673 [Lentinula raphanica]